MGKRAGPLSVISASGLEFSHMNIPSRHSGPAYLDEKC